MSEFLDKVLSQAAKTPDAVLFANSAGQSISYGAMASQSASLAVWLDAQGQSGRPVCIYGHKDPLMLVCMFAIMRCGGAYVPLDTSFPQQRIDSIVSQLDDPYVLCTVAPLGQLSAVDGVREVLPQELAAACSAAADQSKLETLSPVADDDIQYILFTSGSTGTPKGVAQRAQSIDLTSRYFSSLLPQGEGFVCFNRAPFSFDLSLFDFLLAAPNGHTMFALDEHAEKSLATAFDALSKADLSVWVSTPSFLAMCLADPSFGPQLLPKLKLALMCGETLLNHTAAQFIERFGNDVALINLYGPTETCGAVTDVRITPEMAASPDPLPVGTASPYSEIHIIDRQTGEEAPCGTEGEIVILGETCAAGYHRLPDKTAVCFGMRHDHAGRERMCYLTGDAGFIDEDGMLQYRGRFDLQLKVNGYRIELGDIEENLAALPQVASCAVVPVNRNGSNTALAAHVVCAKGTVGDRHLTKALKEALKEVLPAYMVPRTFTYHDELPTNVNGKIDRKALAAAGASARRAD